MIEIRDAEHLIAIFASLILLIWFSVIIFKTLKHHYEVNKYVKRLKATEEQCDIAKFLIKEKAKEWNIDSIIIKDSTCFENNFIIHIHAMSNDNHPHISNFHRTIADEVEIENYVFELRMIICLRNQVLEQDQTIQKFLIENDMLRNGIKKETEITIQTT